MKFLRWLTISLAAFGAVHVLGGFTRSETPPEPQVSGCQELGKNPAKPIKLHGKIFATYLPDGQRYRNDVEHAKPDPFEVGVLDLDRPGTPIQRLTNDDVNDSEIAISPDHKKIIWTVRPFMGNFENGNALHMADLDFSNRKEVTSAPGYLGIAGWATPSTSTIMYSAGEPTDDFAKLKFLDIETGAARVLKTVFRGTIADPQMSPDGKKIAFKSNTQHDTDDHQLYIMNADGTGVKRLTKNKFKDEDPAFSPNGRTLAFERMYGDTDHQGQDPSSSYFQEGIVSLDLKSGKETMLTEPDVCGKNELWLPTWSPDGEYLMFTRGLHLETGEFTHDLWVMRKNGSDLQRVPNSDGIIFFDWIY